MSKELEEGLKLELDWNKLEKAVEGTKGIIPVAVQHADTKEVILVAYINQLAFEESLRRKGSVPSVYLRLWLTICLSMSPDGQPDLVWIPAVTLICAASLKMHRQKDKMPLRPLCVRIWNAYAPFQRRGLMQITCRTWKWSKALTSARWMASLCSMATHPSAIGAPRLTW